MSAVSVRAGVPFTVSRCNFTKSRYVFEEKYVIGCIDEMDAPDDFFDPVEELTDEDRSILY